MLIPILITDKSKFIKHLNLIFVNLNTRNILLYFLFVIFLIFKIFWFFFEFHILSDFEWKSILERYIIVLKVDFFAYFFCKINSISYWYIWNITTRWSKFTSLCKYSWCKMIFFPCFIFYIIQRFNRTFNYFSYVTYYIS